jgi:hypothetical protein
MPGRNVAVQVPGINAVVSVRRSIRATVGFPAAGVENEPVKAGSRDMRAA